MDETTEQLLERMEGFAKMEVKRTSECPMWGGPRNNCGHCRRVGPSRDMIAAAQHLADVEELRERFTVAEKVVTELWKCRHDNGLDGQDIADLLIDCGAAKFVTVTEPCTDEGCLCSEVGEFPTGCFRKEYPS